MNLPKVSIVIPVYNGSNYLKGAIESALNQTYKNIEIIVVNDGSEDEGKTEKIALSFGNAIRYFVKDNGGVASAVNVAIENMQGEFFSWLSHDDEYYPEKIERQINVLISKGDMLRPVISSYDIVDEITGNESNAVIESQYLIQHMEKGEFSILATFLNTVTILLHKNHFQRCGVFNESLETTQDYDMWFRIFHNVNPIYINEPLIKWRYHSEQGSRAVTEHSKNCDLLHLNLLHEMMLRNDEIRYIYGDRYNFLFQIAKTAQNNKFDLTFKQALKYLLWEKESSDLCEAIQGVARRLMPLSKGKVAIFGFGKDGQKMYTELKSRKIKVDIFLDNNVNKIGTSQDGVQCVGLETLDYESDIVIIAITKYQDILLQLKKAGTKNILLQNELREWFYEIPIYKENVKRYFKEGRE